MDMPPIDRTAFARQSGAEGAAVSAVARVMPVAPVNPVVTAGDETGFSPSVVNRVGQSPSDGKELVYTSVADPMRRGAEADTAPRDWTIHRPETAKVEDPPPVPMSKMLMDHLASLWAASASAVQVQTLVRNQLEISSPNQAVAAQPSPNAMAAVTYSTSKVAKNEKI
jgi:hypothetical protein